MAKALRAAHTEPPSFERLVHERLHVEVLAGERRVRGVSRLRDLLDPRVREECSAGPGDARRQTASICRKVANSGQFRYTL